MSEINLVNQVYRHKEDEEILVVPRKKLFPQEITQGIKKIDFYDYEELINCFGIFMWRSQAEIDPNFKQIIPYLIFNFNDKYFLVQRKSSASEVRLQNKYSLAIGGHIRKEDIAEKNIINWAWREFHEEVSYSGKLEIEPLGILNDEADFVGTVHTGFVFLLKGDNENIKIRSELKSGTLLTLDECKHFYSNMESWSQFVFNHLLQTKE